jgi:tRNA threonylcarbamoyladenosine biosynthesis protein TsaE
MKTVGEPGKQPGLGGRQIDAGHPDLGESKLMGPAPDVSHQLRTVDLTALERHSPIVGSTGQALVWPNEEATRAYAARLAAHPAIVNAFIELHGSLGAGKTTLVRHLLRAMGVQGRIKSPTYTVMEPYEAQGGQIFHFDFYRFHEPRELEDAGFRDVFGGPGLKIAEWPEKAAGLQPLADLVIRIELRDDDDARLVTLNAQTPTGQELLP